MVTKQPLQSHDSSRNGHVWETNQPRVRGAPKKKKLAEVLVHRDQDAALVGSPFQDDAVPWVRAALPAFSDVVALGAQPFGEASSGTPVDKKPQPIRTASRVSPAITL